MFTIKNSKPLIYGVIFAATLGAGIARAMADEETIPDVSATPLSAENYCHLQFPAISPDTLGTDHPQLEDPSSGDIIDFYGPCDHNPLGKDEVEQQEQDQLVRGLRNWADF